MGRADQLAGLKQGPLDAKSVPPLGQPAGVGTMGLVEAPARVAHLKVISDRTASSILSATACHPFVGNKDGIPVTTGGDAKWKVCQILPISLDWK